MLWGTDARINSQEQWHGNPEYPGTAVPAAPGCGGSLANTQCNLGKACDRDPTPPPQDGWFRNLFPLEVIERDSRIMLDEAATAGITPANGRSPLENRGLPFPMAYQTRESEAPPLTWNDLNPADVAATVALARSLDHHCRSTIPEIDELRRMVLTVEQRAEARVRQAEAERHSYQDRIRATLEEVVLKLESQEEHIREKLNERIAHLGGELEEQRRSFAGMEDHIGRVEAAAAAAATAAAEGCARALESSTAELQKEIEGVKAVQDEARFASSKPENLKVTLVGAEGLPNKGGRAAELSDAYAVCHIVGQEGFRTPVIANTLAPTWNHTGSIPNFGRADLLEIQVWDRNTLRQDVLIGSAQLSYSALHAAGFGKNIDLPLLAGGEATKSQSAVRVFIGADASEPSPEEAMLSSVESLARDMGHVQAQALDLAGRMDAVQQQMSGLATGAAEQDYYQRQLAMVWELESRMYLLEAHLEGKGKHEELAAPPKEADCGGCGVIRGVQQRENTSLPGSPLFGRPTSAEALARPPPAKAPEPAPGPAPAVAALVPAPVPASAPELAEKLPSRLMSSLAAQKEHIQLRARTLEKSMGCLQDIVRRDESQDPPPRIVFDGATGQVIESPH